jgi:heme-degrading monooxygenase HmoA
MGAFVHVIFFSIEPAATQDLVARIRSTLEALEVAKTPGHLGGAILVSDDEARVAVVSEWNDRHSWAQAQWDRRVQDAVVEVYQTAEHVESQSYNEVFRFDATRGPG